jgi:translation initiation factor eIF-2B subunit epsilon
LSFARMLSKSKLKSGAASTCLSLSILHSYRSASKWSQPSSGLKITPIVTAKETFSPGDAMRDVYTHGVITGDFVLVTGDLVSNVRIDDVVRAHKERRRTNKDAIMTMVMKESGLKHRTR